MAPILDQLAKRDFPALDAGLLLLAGCVAALSVLLVRLRAAPRRR
ncbi:hypothetical protein [Oleiharenicola sp. Vm1]